MNQPVNSGVHKAVDSIQERLVSYAWALNYNSLPPEVIHDAKVRVIDTLGALIGGFFGEPCRIARDLAAQVPDAGGATVIGTRMKTTPDMAAFVNGTTARHVELNDFYHNRGLFGGHPSDTLTPVLAAAEHAGVSGRDFISGVVLAYEVYQRISDFFHHPGFDHTNFACIGTAVAAGKLLGLSREQLSHCISMAVVPNNILRQVRVDHMTMWKAVATGHAGRAGVFAALLARAGMEGPHLPFEGKAGWLAHVCGERFSLDTTGGNGTPFMILDATLKLRPAAGNPIAAILAAEKIAPFRNLKDVKQVVVEVNQYIKDRSGTGEHRWNPDSREACDHSVPYLVAATLMDGTITLCSFNDAHLWNPELRALMKRIEVTENEEFTKAYNRVPRENHARVTVVTNSGGRIVGKTGGGRDDLSAPKSDAWVEEKFRGLAEDVLGAKQANAILRRLWDLDKVANVAEIPPAFVLD